MINYSLITDYSSGSRNLPDEGPYDSRNLWPCLVAILTSFNRGGPGPRFPLDALLDYSLSIHTDCNFEVRSKITKIDQGVMTSIEILIDFFSNFSGSLSLNCTKSVTDGEGTFHTMAHIVHNVMQSCCVIYGNALRYNFI